MDWMTRLNLALDYIEVNLDGDIDQKHAAKLAACSAILVAACVPMVVLAYFFT